VLPALLFIARTCPESLGDSLLQTRVLFLGDNDLHKPADRFKQLQPILAARGIELDYTDRLQNLNPGKLAGYDAVMVYANHTNLNASGESALLDFVENGGGLVAVHSASACFLNSSAYINLIGAQFQRHGAGAFRETVIAPDHPLMADYQPIESGDEIGVHTRHNTNRIVLTESRNANASEPLTWVREHGQGRVFYTAWGHDERTWSQPAFHGLVERAVRWTSEHSPTRLHARTGLPPLEYIDSPAPLPNYLPNARWGTQGQPLRTMQKPLSPAESLEHMVSFPGFELSLFAAEPDIVNPIWLAWDERGRLWIAETTDYPNELQPEGEGRDRLKICADTDGDGRADRFTVFADGLSIPTGFVFAGDGVIVIHSGKTELLRDTDADDRADERRVLFEGWGTRDTHATASNLRYGFDNWIWGTVGYSGFRGEVGGKEIRFGQGIFRFKPDGSALEFIRSSNNNTWGLGLSEEGLVFGSTANGNASMYLPIPNRYYEAVHGWSASRLETIADSQRFFPLTEKVRQVDFHGRYTAGAGSAIYTARSFPQSYWNRVQFVAEPTGHLLGKFHLVAHGSDFVAHNGRNFLASDDEWSSPVVAEVGPDGALWVSDWYDYIIQHNPTPEGFRTGRGNAYDTPLRDKSHGRIYRVSYRETQPSPQPRLDRANPAGLLEALSHPNLLWRLHAQRLLLHRAQRDVVPALWQRVRDMRVDELGLSPGSIHALWTLHGLGALEPPDADMALLNHALAHPSAAVRRAAVSVLPQTAAALSTILESGLLKDPDPQVRLATLLAIADMPPADGAANAVYHACLSIHDDRWLADAATAAAARNDTAFLITALLEHPRRPANPKASNPAHAGELAGVLGPVIRTVTGHYARRGPDDHLVSILKTVAGASPAIAIAVLDSLVDNWPEDATPTLTEADRAALHDLMQSVPDFTRDRVLALSLRWGLRDLFGREMAGITSQLRRQIADTSLEDAQRVNAAGRLITIDPGAETIRSILQPIQLLTPPGLATPMVNILAGSREENTASLLLDHWPNFSPAVRRTAVSLLMRRPQWTRALLDAIGDGRMPRTDLAMEQWAQLRQNPNGMIARRAERLSAASSPVSADRHAIVERLLPLAQEKGDAARGREVYAANCALCHVYHGEGGKVGPDLTGLASRERRDILLEILDPNRSVEANYRLWNVTTRDDEILSGRLDAETQTTIELLDTNGQKHIVQRNDIARLEPSPLSVMPAGFETLPAEDLKGLLEYLSTPPTGR
jgi:putative membrane-bound dehydrogenase-like protein